jgi:hypothetical protein
MSKVIEGTNIKIIYGVKGYISSGFIKKKDYYFEYYVTTSGLFLANGIYSDNPNSKYLSIASAKIHEDIYCNNGIIYKDYKSFSENNTGYDIPNSAKIAMYLDSIIVNYNKDLYSSKNKLYNIYNVYNTLLNISNILLSTEPY